MEFRIILPVFCILMFAVGTYHEAEAADSSSKSTDTNADKGCTKEPYPQPRTQMVGSSMSPPGAIKEKIYMQVYDAEDVKKKISDSGSTSK